MKPLPVAPLTPEDFRIFTNHGGDPIRGFWMGRRNVLYRDADRRDADLMLELAELRWMGAYADVRMLQTMAGQDGCSVGGWMGHYRWVSGKWSDGRNIT